MEVHAGAPGKDSKSAVLFCPAPPHVYTDAETYDDADLSDVQLPGGLTMPVVFFFKYLGDIISSDGTDVRAVEARLTDASKAFGALRKGLFTSHQVSVRSLRAPSARRTRRSSSPSSSSAVRPGA